MDPINVTSNLRNIEKEKLISGQKIFSRGGEVGVAVKIPKMRLKVAMKLLTIVEIEAQGRKVF